jgi:hypothetical protein
MTYELRASATRDEEKVDICYERSGGYIEFDLLELLCCTSASYQVSRMNAPPHGPHVVPCAAPLVEPVDPPPRDLSFHSRNHFSSPVKANPTSAPPSLGGLDRLHIRTQAVCAGPGSRLVRMSACCAFDSMCSSRTTIISTPPRAWWCRNAISFVLGCEDGI